MNKLFISLEYCLFSFIPICGGVGGRLSTLVRLYRSDRAMKN